MRKEKEHGKKERVEKRKVSFEELAEDKKNLFGNHTLAHDLHAKNPYRRKKK
jgi:hypothetical protein